jgi:hypothetical protein
MVGRLIGAVSLLAREVASLSAKGDRMPEKNYDRPDATTAGSKEEKVLQEHRDFMMWYQNFLMSELIPTASYQRHITSLRAIQILLDSGIMRPYTKPSVECSADMQSHGSLTENVFTEKMMRILLDLVMDPFEDVRAGATQLLKLAPTRCFIPQHYVGSSDDPPFQSLSVPIGGMLGQNRGRSSDKFPSEAMEAKKLHHANVPGALISFIQRTEIASRRTGRADLADGVARAYELIYGLQVTDETRLDLLGNLVFDLESKVAVAEDNLTQAVLLAPVHGQFAALR